MKYAESYTKLASFGRELLQHTSLEEGLPMIAENAKELIGAERCSIYMYDPKEEQLWTILSDGVETIRIDAGKGIAGSTLTERKPVVVNDPYADARFFSEVDRETGYVTKNIASVPVFDSGRNIIGVLQLLNKDGGFDMEDARFMVFFAHYISGYLELASFFREDQE